MSLSSCSVPIVLVLNMMNKCFKSTSDFGKNSVHSYAYFYSTVGINLDYLWFTVLVYSATLPLKEAITTKEWSYTA